MHGSCWRLPHCWSPTAAQQVGPDPAFMFSASGCLGAGRLVSTVQSCLAWKDARNFLNLSFYAKATLRGPLTFICFSSLPGIQSSFPPQQLVQMAHEEGGWQAIFHCKYGRSS